MVSSSTSKPPYEIRSISLPPRSHPTTLLIQEELNKLKAWEASSSSASICIGLSGLVELYRHIDDLLNLPLTQQALSQHQHEKWVNELLDGSMRFLDICGSTRDTISSIKENLREVQSSLRRRKAGDSAIEADVNAYISFLRRTKADAEKSLASLKHMDKKVESSAPLLDLDHHLSAVVRVLREASSVTGAVFSSLLSFLSVPAPAKKRSSRWGGVARLVHRGVVTCESERESLNELEAVDIALSNLKNGEGVKKKMEALDMAMEGLEDGLESVFRRLIQTRVSFLNILSQ